MVFPAVFDDSNGIGFLPPVIDESIQLGCIVLPLLCLLWTLAERAFRCCCPKCCRPSARVAPDPLADVGISNLDVPALLQKHFPQHGPFLGVYAQVVGGGAVRVGDRLVAAAA